MFKSIKWYLTLFIDTSPGIILEDFARTYIKQGRHQI